MGEVGWGLGYRIFDLYFYLYPSFDSELVISVTIGGVEGIASSPIAMYVMIIGDPLGGGERS